MSLFSINLIAQNVPIIVEFVKISIHVQVANQIVLDFLVATAPWDIIMMKMQERRGLGYESSNCM